MSLLLLLLVAAFVLAAAALVQSDGRNLTAWGVLILALVGLMGRV